MASNYCIVDSSGNKYIMNVGGVTISRSYRVDYKTAGTYTWAAPAGVTSADIEVAGAGGGYGIYSYNCYNGCDCNCSDDS